MEDIDPNEKATSSKKRLSSWMLWQHIYYINDYESWKTDGKMGFQKPLTVLLKLSEANKEEDHYLAFLLL